MQGDGDESIVDKSVDVDELMKLGALGRRDIAVDIAVSRRVMMLFGSWSGT